MGFAVPILLAVAGGGLAWGALILWSRHKQARWSECQRMLEELSSRFGIDLEWDEEGAKFTGTARGRSVEYRFVMLGVVEGVTHYGTRVEVTAPVSGFELDVRARTLVTRITGTLGNVKTDDPAFDRAYLATGMPEKVAKEVLDAEMRSWLLSQGPARLQVQGEGLFFEKDARLDHEAEIRSILLGLVHLAERVEMATEPRGYRDQH